MDDAAILFVTVLIALLLTTFNFTTVAIAVIDRKLRSRISNYPVISFLIASTFQGMFAAPITTYKQMEHKEHITGWVCDLSRVSYYLCHHLVKISLVIVSFDRLFSIKYPFKYAKYGKKKNMVIFLVACWMITIVVDMLPFIHTKDDDVCHYVVKQQWRMFNIVVYNITPFLIISMNYIIIWFFAANVALFDRRVNASIRYNNRNSHQESLKSGERNKSKLQFMLELKATKTSLALVGVYIVCWGPLGLYYIIENFCKQCISINKDVEKDLHDGLTYLCFSSNVLAPLSYCWLCKDYRKAGKRILRRLGVESARTLFSFSLISRPTDALELTTSSASQERLHYEKISFL